MRHTHIHLRELIGSCCSSFCSVCAYAGMVVLEMLRGHVPPVAVLMVMLLLHNTKHKPEAGLQ